MFMTTKKFVQYSVGFKAFTQKAQQDIFFCGTGRRMVSYD